MSLKPSALLNQIRIWGKALGFQHIGISDLDLGNANARLQNWVAQQYHGSMEYMTRHGNKRSDPALLVPGTLCVISARMDYYPPSRAAFSILNNPELGYVSRYALGRDYHKLMRKRLKLLAEKIASEIHPLGYRVFSDSAPILEKALAEKAGLGWIGKHTNLIHKAAGSWFFLGEIFTTLPLTASSLGSNHCGSCTACVDVCPTKAIVAPYTLDARRCISYLTIENKGVIPEEFREAMGNRIYGCDDCQLVCPWNRYAKITGEKNFWMRHSLDGLSLLTLFCWTETDFLHFTQGSAIARIGYERWQRNIAIALGNAPSNPEIILALQTKMPTSSPLVQEHMAWALKKQERIKTLDGLFF